MSCPHFINFTVENPSILEVLGVTETTKKSAYKLHGLAVGFTGVTAAFTGTDPCPGSASPTISVQVTPDENVTLKQWKSITGTGIKQIKGKPKQILTDFCEEASGILDDYAFFDIDAEEADVELFEAAVGAVLRFSEGMDNCLALLSTQGSDLLAVSGLPSIPEPFQAGSCTSLWEQLRAAEARSGDLFTKLLTKKLKSDTKPLVSQGLIAHLRVLDYALIERASPTETANTRDTYVRSPRFTLTGSYRFDELAGLQYGGLADATKSQVHVDVSGPNGFMDSRDVDVIADVGATWGSFSLTLMSPTLTDSGLYRMDVRYLDDVNPSGTVFQSVP